MRHPFIRLYALLAYAAFLASFSYFAGFASGWGVPKTIDDGPATSPLLAVSLDVGLVFFFGLVHSVMARPAFKRAWTRIVPPAAERSTYVLIAAAQVALLCWQWRPIGTFQLWTSGGALALVARTLQVAGWAIALVSTFLIDHWELFGLRQGLASDASKPVLRTPLFYRWVRHPLYFGMLLALWSTPTMSAGHLLLAALLTAYVLIGVKHEERDLVRVFGDEYRRYQATVPMLLPLPRRASSGPLAGASAAR
ncbi:MAG: isoprenylcysteine carboxylmethyltransferase family protein [Myxococcales bacterium]